MARRIPAADEDREERQDEDEVARFGRGRAAQPGGKERRHRDADHAQSERAGFARHRHEPDERKEENDDEDGPVTRAEVPRRLPEVRDDRPRAAELRSVAAHADVEAARENQVREPERRAGDRNRREGDHRLPQPVTPCRKHEYPLSGEHERAVGMRGDGEQDRQPPEAPGAPGAAVERPEEQHEREQREEQEQAVHAGVDPVEEEHPAAGGERRRDQGRPAVGEAPSEESDQRQAADGEHRRDEAEAAEAEVEMGHPVCEEEMERRAAAITGDVLDHPAEAVAADEEREGLVLVRRPGHQLVEQEPAGGGCDHTDADPERVGVEKRARRGGERASARGGFGGLCHRP